MVSSPVPDDQETGGANSVAAVARLRGRLDAALRAGERQLPPERHLAAELSVGRGALRRALEVLEAEGLVWRIQGKGTFIGAPPAEPDPVQGLSSRTNPLEVMEVRLLIEPALARLAALRATPEEIAMMRHLAKRVAAAADAEGYELWDGALHHRIAEAAGNRLFVGLFELIDQVRQDERFQMLRQKARPPGFKDAYLRQHDRILDAIADRDASGAEAAMRDHIETVAQRLTAAMQGPVPWPVPVATSVQPGASDG